MGDADREEARNLARFLRLTRLARDVDEAQRVVAARQRLELQLRINSARFRAMPTPSPWGAG